MATISLTETKIARFRFDTDGPRIQRLWDTQVSGLGVEVFPTGRRTWIFRYRLHGKQRLITMAPLGDLRLEEARDEAIEYRRIIRTGADPKRHRDAPTEGLTLDKIYERYTETTYFKSRSADFRNNLASTYRRYLKPDVGHYPAAAIDRGQIRDLVQTLIEEGKEGAARGLLNRARILFNYAVQQGLIDGSPADHIRPSYTSSGRRTAWLDDVEKLKEAWWFAGAPQARGLIRWALLTGCRRDEARTTQHAQIDNGIWTVPDTKNGRDLVLPMMPAMSQVVEEMQATFRKTTWLFPATTNTHKALPRGTLDYMIREGSSGQWSMHTLRHTVESYLRELEVVEETRDLILNHVRQSTGERYGHGRALELKRRGLEVWHRYLLQAVDAAPAALVNREKVPLLREVAR